MSQDTKSKAQLSKEKGNEAFKKGDYANAVGFYTAAMMDDPKEPIYALNRAFAYLKLGKNEDCIRDCTTAITLAPKTAKAWFRRGQAKLALGQADEAEKDLREANILNPKDDDVAALCMKVIDENFERRKKILDEKIESHTGPYVDPSGQPPRRRRVPITVIESPKAPAATPVQKLTKDPEATTPSVAAPPVTAATSSPQPKPSSFKEAKEARDTARPSRVGGGIFRSTGSATVFPTREAVKPGDHSATASDTAREGSGRQERSSIKAPATLFDLVRQWNSLKTAEERWELFSTIPPYSLPPLCKTSLEPSFLASVFSTLSTILTTADLNTQIQVRLYMECIPIIPRFGTLWMLMSKPEKNVVWDIWRKLGVDVETKEGKDSLDQGWKVLLK
ncbi:hypothetical protein BKA70DRAFT_1370240 [Coprinopsis sp. MPI-PUGE-AT-0042]|nr:hypothetical protein BKA70DRAFT_1370240 [Coprinopsis sp. MPI-PUGE-AT-0042]